MVVVRSGQKLAGYAVEESAFKPKPVNSTRNKLFVVARSCSHVVVAVFARRSRAAQLAAWGRL